MKGAFPDLEESYTNFRVDPYDPYRVWADLISTGNRTGEFAFNMAPSNQFVKTTPEAVSFTFDDDGYCMRLTNAAIMDPTVGNSGGLGGVYGLLYGSGSPLVDTSTRPWPQIQLRLQKAVSSPLTGVGVDDYTLPGKASIIGIPTPAKMPKLKAPPQMPKLDNRFEAPKPPAAPKIDPPKVSLPKVSLPPPKKAPPKASTPVAKKPAAPKPKVAPPRAPPKAKKAPIRSEPADPVSDAFNAFFASRIPAAAPKAPKAAPKKAPKAAAKKAPKVASKAKAAPKKAPKVAAKVKAVPKKAPKVAAKANENPDAAAVAAKKKVAEDAKRKKESAAVALKEENDRKLQALRDEREAVKQEALRKKEKTQRAADSKKAELEQLKLLKQQQQQKANAVKAKEVVKVAAPGATISLASLFGSAFGFDTGNTPASSDTDESSSSKAASAKMPKKREPEKVITSDLETAVKPPRGVPVLNNWRRNFNGSITGKVSASKDFEDGELITTSRIATGNIKSGNLVETSSGSKYFLS
jgi:hypothetical protein